MFHDMWYSWFCEPQGWDGWNLEPFGLPDYNFQFSDN